VHPAPDAGAEQDQGEIGEQQQGGIHCRIVVLRSTRKYP
jgi:hypothetical protein